MFFLDLLFTESLSLVLLALTLAVVPLSLWIYVFYRKHPVDRSLAILTTLGGMLVVIPVWAYQWALERYDHLDIFGTIRTLDLDTKIIYLVTFIVIGVIEEQLKHWVVVITARQKKEWRGVADAIEFSILAALGFAFIENIIYFLGIIKIEGYGELLIPFVFRSLFSTFAHIFFSGVYGYHFGIAKHAKEWLIEEMRPRYHHKFFIIRFFYHLLRFRILNILTRLVALVIYIGLVWGTISKITLPIMARGGEALHVQIIAGVASLLIILWFTYMIHTFWRHVRYIRLDQVLAREEITEGLFLAMALHAIFNFILWLEWTWIIPIYLFSGYLYLSYELKLRKNLLDFESVEEKLRRAHEVSSHK